MGNTALSKAKSAKNDEFYTQYADIQKEVNAYLDYDAIEVPFTDAIPSDYKGMMGVPISFLDKCCPEQFEILGHMDSHGKAPKGIPDEAPYLNGKWVYSRILIRHREQVRKGKAK